MKKLTTTLLLVCIMALVACQNGLDNPALSANEGNMPEQAYAQLSIGRAGGTPDRTEAGIADFLKTVEFQGVYSTVSGYTGFKIKDGELYEITAHPVTGTVWKKLDRSAMGIAVDKDLKKLQIEELNGTVTKIYTFDGFGYYIFENGEGDLATYYSKYDFPEKYAGFYTSPQKSVRVTITEGGDIKYMNGKYGNFDWITGNYIFEGNTLTVKGAYWNGNRVVFSADGKSVTCYSAAGAELP